MSSAALASMVWQKRMFVLTMRGTSLQPFTRVHCCGTHGRGWRPDDYDRLCMGTLAGHLIECSAQCTGGLFTDYQERRDGAGIERRHLK